MMGGMSDGWYEKIQYQKGQKMAGTSAPRPTLVNKMELALHGL
jgi:hypothetical protein